MWVRVSSVGRTLAPPWGGGGTPASERHLRLRHIRSPSWIQYGGYKSHHHHNRARKSLDDIIFGYTKSNYLIPDGSTGNDTYITPRSPAKEVCTSFRSQPPSPRSHHNLRKSHRHSQPFASTHESSRPQNKVTDVLQTCISPMGDQVLNSSQRCFTDTKPKKGSYTFYRCLPYPFPTVIATLVVVVTLFPTENNQQHTCVKTHL